MWRVLFKLIAMKFFSNRLHRVGLQLMAITERRAHIFIQSLKDEWQRVVTTVACFLVGLVFLAFSAVVAIVWFVATALESPDRNLILGIAVAIPLVLVIAMVLYVRTIWQKKIFLQSPREQMEEDWSLLRASLREKAEVSQAGLRH